MKRVTVILEVLILVGLVGCGKSKEKTIVGKWKEVGGTQTIEFFKDGTVTVVDKGEPPLTGDYRFIDDSRIRMDLKGIGELLGPVIAEISISRDMITLTNPSGEIEKYQRLKQIGKVTKSNIAGDYTIVVKMPDGEEFKNPALITLKENGTGLTDLSGKWKIIGDNQLEFPTRKGELLMIGGEIKADTLYREPLEMSLTRQRNAKVIENLEGKNILWSKYYFRGSGSSKIKSISLEIKKDGTFQEVGLYKDVWRVKNGIVEITTIGKKQKEKKLKGRVDGNTIVFQDDETELRYIRAENVYDIVGEKAQKESGTKRDIARAKMAIIEDALAKFYIDCGRYPDDSEGLDVFLMTPMDAEEKWNGPYLKRSELLDPWDNPYVYVAEGEVNPGSFDLVSFGADGMDGGEGDDEDIWND